MPFAAALSTAPQTPQALEEVCAQARPLMTGEPHLAVLFFSTHHLGAAELLGRTVRERLAPRRLLGCVGEAVIGTGREVEQGPALSLWLGRWAGPVTLEPFHLVLERTPDGPSLLGWPDALTGADPAQAAVLLLGDPFTFPVDLFL
jgi:small ligand-binding sensory domain FIST